MAIQIKDIFSQLYKIVFDIFFYTAILSIVLAVLPDHLFKEFPIQPTRFLNEHLNKGIGKHSWNNDLVVKATHIGKGQLLGGESLVEVGDWIYTGLTDGRLVRVHKRTHDIENVVRLVGKVSDCRKLLLMLSLF